MRHAVSDRADAALGDGYVRKRVFLIVLDGVGVGAAPDAADYGDAGSDTLGHVLARFPDLRIPALTRLGIRSIRGTSFYRPGAAAGLFGRCAQASAGKDTTTGHWEIAGLIRSEPFPTYPAGFPDTIIREFSARTGRGVLGNRTASGTRIIEELGDEHRRTGSWIVYTSADSVFQIAAHEETIPPEELYAACRVARSILHPPHGVGRVIARPFAGPPGGYYRTQGRRDFSLEPTGPTLPAVLSDAGIPVTGVGKIRDIFAGVGIASSIRGHDNRENLEATLDLVEDGEGLVFVNLVDFDMLYGHRRDPEGFAACLEDCDRYIARIVARLRPGDIMILTADHGCDPTYAGTDHTREWVPVLVAGPARIAGRDAGDRASFADIARTVLDYFGLPPISGGAPLFDAAQTG